MNWLFLRLRELRHHLHEPVHLALIVRYHEQLYCPVRHVVVAERLAELVKHGTGILAQRPNPVAHALLYAVYHE